MPLPLCCQLTKLDDGSSVGGERQAERGEAGAEALHHGGHHHGLGGGLGLGLDGHGGAGSNAHGLQRQSQHGGNVSARWRRPISTAFRGQSTIRTQVLGWRAAEVAALVPLCLPEGTAGASRPPHLHDWPFRLRGSRRPGRQPDRVAEGDDEGGGAPWSEGQGRWNCCVCSCEPDYERERYTTCGLQDGRTVDRMPTTMKRPPPPPRPAASGGSCCRI